MNSEEKNLINTLIREISELRGELKEFKENIVYRLVSVENRCEEKQKNPESCSIGRELERHIERQRQKIIGGRGFVMLVIQAGVFAVMIFTFFKGR